MAEQPPHPTTGLAAPRLTVSSLASRASRATPQVHHQRPSPLQAGTTPTYASPGDLPNQHLSFADQPSGPLMVASVGHHLCQPGQCLHPSVRVGMLLARASPPVRSCIRSCRDWSVAQAMSRSGPRCWRACGGNSKQMLRSIRRPLSVPPGVGPGVESYRIAPEPTGAAGPGGGSDRP